MKPTPINQMTEAQLQIAIKAKEMSMDCTRRLISQADTLPLSMVVEFWEELQRQTKQLEKLQELATN